MAVTFLRQQGRQEMLTRLGTMPYPGTRHVVGTFHGLCNRFLRAHWKQAGTPPQTFSILDADTVRRSSA